MDSLESLLNKDTDTPEITNLKINEVTRLESLPFPFEEFWSFLS
jgi:hypothetical protein